MNPTEYVRRLQKRAEAYRALPVGELTAAHPQDRISGDCSADGPAFRRLQQENAADWAAINATPGTRLAVCRELLRGYWDLGRLQ